MRPGKPSEMPDSRAFTAIYKGLVVVFLGLCLLSGLLLSDIIKTGLVIDTNLRALLPETEDNVLSQHAETRLLNRLGHTVILLVGATTPEKATEAADFGRAWLHSQTSLRANSASPLSHDPEHLILQMKEYRFHLLTPEQRQLLENDSPDALINRGWASVLEPQSWVRMISTQEDPLALFDGFVEWISQISSTATITRYGGYSLFSTAKRPGWFFAPLYIDTGTQAFQLGAQAKTVLAITRLQAKLKQRFAGIETLKSGIIFYAAEAAQRAQGEMTLIGLGSLLGIIVLFVVAFRSLVPLVMSLASVLFGCIIAFSIVHYVYSGVHIITLVFGAALIGVSVDYSLHYFTRLSTATSTNRFAGLRSIFSAISLGLVTSVIGYGSLSQAPLPGLNQIALFSVVGLIGAWLFVIVIYPWLGTSRLKPLPAYLTRWALFPQRCWQNLERRHHLYPSIFLIALGAVAALGIGLTITTNNDIRVLHAPSRSLLKEDKELRTIISNYASNQFFIVTGSTEQEVLQNEEVFRRQLDKLIESRAISGYQSITRFLPSIARQQEDYRLQKLKLYADGTGPAPRFMEQLGFNPAAIKQLLQHFSARKNEYLTPENWPGLTASGLDLLWLGQIDNKFATLILLQGVKNTAALTMAAARFDKVIFIDKIKELSHVLEQQRHSATTMLLLAYVGVIVLLILRYRRVDAILLAMVPLVSTLVTIVLLSSLGMPIGLFHLFAMFLILGLGMDYSIFIYESSITETTSYTAILFSAITTCLSFGLLALSSTPMVRFFGTTVLIGTILNLILAPAVSHLSAKHGLPNKNAGEQ